MTVYINKHVYWNSFQDLQINMLDCYCSIYISIVFDRYIKNCRKTATRKKDL